MSNYPQHDNLKKVNVDSQVIGEFIDWIKDEQCIIFCQWESKYGEFMPVHKSIEQWLALYFEIDLVKLEDEKRQILDVIRQDNVK